MQASMRARGECAPIVAGVGSERTAKPMPPWVIQPYKTADGRSAYCAPEPPIAPLIQPPTAPSSAALRPSINHLYAQHEPFLSAVSGLSIGSHHNSTSPSIFSGGPRRQHAHSSFSVEPRQRTQTFQDKEASGGPQRRQQPDSRDPLMPLYATLSALHNPAAGPSMPIPGMVLPNC